MRCKDNMHLHPIHGKGIKPVEDSHRPAEDDLGECFVSGLDGLIFDTQYVFTFPVCEVLRFYQSPIHEGLLSFQLFLFPLDPRVLPLLFFPVREHISITVAANKRGSGVRVSGHVL